jgi:hypothetical protein
MKRTAVMLVALPLLFCAPLAGAHHSYAEYETDAPSVFSGTVTDVQWRNPHIQLTVSDGVRSMRVDWVTITGAERTGVTADRISTGDRIVVTGARHRDPEQAIMSVIKQIELPDAAWEWKVPVRQ